MIITHINYKRDYDRREEQKGKTVKPKEFRRAVILIGENQMSIDTPANTSYAGKDRKNKSCTATIDCDKIREPYDAKKKVQGYGTEISSSEYTII